MVVTKFLDVPNVGTNISHYRNTPVKKCMGQLIRRVKSGWWPVASKRGSLGRSVDLIMQGVIIVASYPFQDYFAVLAGYIVLPIYQGYEK